MIGDKKRINFTEQGNGFPREGDILINHRDEEAFRVLPDEQPGDGTIRTYPGGRPNECTLVVEELDYEEYAGNPDGWEI